MATVKLDHLTPEYRRINKSGIKGTRSVNTITFNPSSANPGEEIYVNLPKLRPGVCIVPNSLFLSAKFTNKNTKSWFLNNLGRLLVNKLQITVAGEVAYDNNDESQYSVYKDLWVNEKDRGNMADLGVMNENTRKLMSGDDSGDSSSIVEDKAINKMLDKRVRVKLGRILNDHGLFAPYDMLSDIRYKITLPTADDIMIHQSSQKVDGYTLDDIKLEYETIEDADVYRNALNTYDVGRSLSYEHVTLFKRELWDKSTTLINENINLPRKSMRAIVMLFRPKNVTDSEKFHYPHIKIVKITIEGVPNSVYSQAMDRSRFFHEAERLFLEEDHDTLQFGDF